MFYLRLVGSQRIRSRSRYSRLVVNSTSIGLCGLVTLIVFILLPFSFVERTIIGIRIIFSSFLFVITGSILLGISNFLIIASMMVA